MRIKICISVYIIIKLISLECLYKLFTLQVELVEGVKIFLVCVIDQLSVWSHIAIIISKQENFWTPLTNLQSLYLYTTGKFSVISCMDFAITCNRCH